jgi:hypothetical protein
MSLLKQLVQDRPLVPENIKSLYRQHRNQGTSPPLDEISKVLQSIVADYSRTFIIVDALDECQDSDRGRRRFLSEIFNLQAKARSNLFATSRFIPEIMEEFEGTISLEIRANDEDVQRYVNRRVPSLLRSRISKYPELQDTIRREIVKGVDGMQVCSSVSI